MIAKIARSFLEDLQGMNIATRAALILYLVLVFSTGLVALALALAAPKPYVPLVHYVESTVQPDKPSYCPGDEMTFSYHWEAEHTPAVIRISSTFYDPVHQHTVQSMRSGDAQIFIVTGVVANEQTRTVTIPDLPPGKYEHRRAIETNYAESSALVIPFVIREGCPIKEQNK